MKATRVRKKGCPFCKAGPDRCVTWIDRSSACVAICCLECGGSGPTSSIHIQDKAELQVEAWSKWNHRG